MIVGNSLDELRLRIIGDVHGHLGSYVRIAREAPYSICLGDVDFNYKFLNDHLDPVRHRIVAGNHDNYENLSPHFLGDFGFINVPSFGRIFFVRGAYSIDRNQRTQGVDWWPEEELGYRQCIEALDMYSQEEPDMVVSHACPYSLVPKVLTMPASSIKNRTTELLQQMLEQHQPRLWLFAHYHKDWRRQIGRTHFICLPELGWCDFTTDLEHA